MTPRTIVLDANVLMRAVLGRRVAGLLADFAPQVTFLAPDVAFYAGAFSAVDGLA